MRGGATATFRGADSRGRAGLRHTTSRLGAIDEYGEAVRTKTGLLALAYDGKKSVIAPKAASGLRRPVERVSGVAQWGSPRAAGGQHRLMLRATDRSATGGRRRRRAVGRQGAKCRRQREGL